jgi:hypothetical protein
MSKTLTGHAYDWDQDRLNRVNEAVRHLANLRGVAADRQLSRAKRTAMRTSNGYPIVTLWDMAQIPEEAMPRFLAELPEILRAYREIDAASDSLSAEARTKVPWFLRWIVTPEVTRAALRRAAAEWIDDDKKTATVRMRFAENSEDFYVRTEPLA